MTINASRRGFIRGLAGASALGLGGCCSICSGSKKIRLAAVGIMGKGFSDWFPMVKSGKAELVAICDADYNQVAAAQKILNKEKFPLDLYRLPFYSDFRALNDNIGVLGIQAMTISGPDHMHAPCAIPAMKQGVSVYVQKPLVRTLWELDYFNKTAKDNGVVVQMGNQGSALDGLRRCSEIIQTGILGDVTEVHVWTNRPVWPQGLFARNAALNHPIATPNKDLDWNAWLSVAADRPYRAGYTSGSAAARFDSGLFHAFNWRGFFDFGAGAFGDMACHTMNLPFRGAELGMPTKAECKMAIEPNDVAYPVRSIVEVTYASRKSRIRKGHTLPETKVVWYDGDHQPPADIMPQVVATLRSVPRTGCFLQPVPGLLGSADGRP